MDSNTTLDCGYIAAGDHRLYAGYAPGTTPDALLVLAPFGEERKCAYRLLVETADELRDRFHVLRFDYAGTGESTGDHSRIDLDVWAGNARAAAAELRELSGCERLWLLGARLGANLGVQLLDDIDAAGVLLWEPLPTGQAFLDEMVRRKQIKEMMGGGQANSLAAELETAWERDEAVDFDGFAVNARLAAGLKALDLKEVLAGVDRPLRLIHVTGAKKMSGVWAELEEQLGDRFQVVRERPFWGLMDYQEHRLLKDATASWLRSRQTVAAGGTETR